MGMTREEYEGKRNILHERMVVADEEIHKQERNCDDDVRLGDVKAFQYHDNCMKSAEDDFKRTSEEAHQLDQDYWGDADKSASSESGKEQEASATAQTQNTAQTEQADYWSDNTSGNSASDESEHEQKNSLSK